MKKAIFALVLTATAASLGGCSYSGVGAVGDKAVIARPSERVLELL